MEPGSRDNVITVAASDNYAPYKVFSNWSPQVAFVAPAIGLVVPYGFQDGATMIGGSSFAAPQIAAAIAILRQAFPACEWADIRAGMENIQSKATMSGSDFDRPLLKLLEMIDEVRLQSCP